MKKTPEQIIKRFDKLKADRQTWEQHWQELADYMLPRKNDIQRQFTPGQKRNTQILDNTGMVSAELLAGALHGLLTNPYSQWFGLTTGDPDLDVNDSVRAWLQDSERRMLGVLNDSNFQTEVHEYYLDLTVFNTAVLTMEEDEKDIVRFNARFIASLVLEENNKGSISDVYREFSWSARQLADEFGLEKLPKKIKEAYEKGLDTKFSVIHCVYPKDVNSKKRGPLSQFDFYSQYIAKADKEEIDAKGFNESPYLVSRWAKASDEVYGRGPGQTALPEVKIINKMTETIIKASQKMIDPPLQLPDDGFIMPIKTKPGGLNFYRSGSNDRIEPVFNKEIRVDFGYQAMDQHRERIKQAFYVDQLMLSNVGPQMTATEVNQRTEERMRLLGPMLGRQQSEFLSPLIDRLFKVMFRKQLLKPIPQALANHSGLSVQYSSVIAKMQRTSDGQNIDRTLQALAPFVQSDPSILDNLNGDAALREISRIYNFPQTIIRDEMEVKKIRKSRADAQAQIQQQQQQQQQAQQAQQVLPAVAQMQMAQKQQGK